MRQSVATSARQSQVPNPAANAAAAARLLEKKKEYEMVAALDRASAQFVKRLEELSNDFDVMADAGTVHGQVLEQWPNMFRILSLFLSTREGQSNNPEAQPPATGERLVRVPVEGLRSTDERST
ncbi:hypothetical protein POSPLADRAFT_1053321 [Postia placenta MAD-698-R-SB12]|uniref:DASH complex subunit DAD2 n=1 Tax=Postia placenta MAD-698-R-SB12 TaxID=670580 RepID=A0A1X6NDV8_9APHY|nr:hypothetical protein POSPLADRAFT_1053321 [Postia placenta MAD-698-R-SB12]OSX66700.1 hypothetical protein POSPLADRAFT_1053321 [Postia placenta MAD-698-R-SB12]